VNREQAALLHPGDTVFVEGGDGLGKVTKTTGDVVWIDWDDGKTGLLYAEARMIPNISRLHRVGGDPLTPN